MRIERSAIDLIEDVAKCVGIAVLTSLGGVLIFALVIHLAALSSSVIVPINQVIKVIAIFLGCVLGFRPERGILKGAIGGVLSITVTYFIFAFLSGGMQLQWTALLELLFGGIVGALCGIISVNLHK